MSTPELQDELLQALTRPTSDLDLAYDFFHISGSYFADRDEYPESVEELTPEQLQSFARWLRREGIALEVRDAPLEVPPSYFFDNPVALPAGTWLIHHGKAPFAKFDRGATMDRLQLSTWYKEPQRASDKNTDDELGLYDRVFAFAFLAEEDPCVRRQTGKPTPRCDRYGPYLILFQSDAAVSVWHPGDQEDQVIFPVGTEYNVRQLGVSEMGTWLVEVGGEDEEFETIQELIEAMELATERR